jgi:ribosome-binding factor A
MAIPGLRTRRVAELIQLELGRLLLRDFQEPGAGFVSVTAVEVTPDLLQARVHLSIFGTDDPEALLERIEASKGALRRALASRVKLKYNPALFFLLDRGQEHAERIDELLERTKKHDA